MSIEQAKRHKLLTLSSSFAFGLFLYDLLIYRTWLASLFSIVPWLLVILTYIFLSSLIIRKYWREERSIFRLILLFHITVLIVVFSYSGINTYSIGNLIRGQREQGISVFVHNSQFWENSEDSSDYIKFLKDQNADIYFIQEFINSYEGFSETNYSFNVRDEIQKIEEMLPGYTVSHSDEFLTISKYPVIQSFSGGIELSSFLRTDLEIEGEVVSMYNIHIPVHLNPEVITNSSLLSFVENTKDRADWRRREIENLIEDIQNNNNPIIVSGDFNTNRNMNTMDMIELENAEIYSKNLFLGTWHSRVPLWMVDYTYFNDEIDFKKLSYVNKPEFSDHVGQKFWFEIKQ